MCQCVCCNYYGTEEVFYNVNRFVDSSKFKFNLVLEQLHRDEETGKVLNLIFKWAEEGAKLEVDIPVVFKGAESCPGLNKG